MPLLVSQNASNLPEGSRHLTLDFVIMRHAQSQGNVWPRQGIFGKTDPSLTDIGKAQGIEAADCLAKQPSLNQPSFVFSSQLLRSQETALLAFPQKNHIYVAPFICETHAGSPWLHPASTVRPHKEHVDALEKDMGEESGQKVSFDMVGSRSCSEPNWKKFLVWLGRRVEVQEMFARAMAASERPCIAVVSHGNFLKQLYGIEEHPNNAQVYLATVDIHLGPESFVPSSVGDIAVGTVVCVGESAASTKHIWYSILAVLIAFIVLCVASIFLRCRPKLQAGRHSHLEPEVVELPDRAMLKSSEL